MPDENTELAYEDFVRARKQYWQQEAGNTSSAAVRPKSDGVSLAQDGGDFILYSAGPQGIVGVLEDCDQSGWFYLYDAKQRKVCKSALIYERANVAVQEEVVDIAWAADDSACGLALWGEFRAFFGLSSNLQLLKPVMDSEERGIPSGEWPAGFEHYLEKKSTEGT